MLDQYSKHVAQQNLQEDTFQTSLNIKNIASKHVSCLISILNMKQTKTCEKTHFKFFLKFQEHCFKYLSCLIYIVENK
jgi:hypothetical protein